jgi:hypothetical protein
VLPIPPEYEGVVAAVVTAAYAISRGLAKAGVDPNASVDPSSETDI